MIEGVMWISLMMDGVSGGKREGKLGRMPLSVVKTDWK